MGWKRRIGMTKARFEAALIRAGNFEELMEILDAKRSTIHTWASRFDIKLRGYWPSFHEPGYLYRRRGVLIHRDVAEEVLGRPLKPTEVVHYIDGNKQNNNKSNLLICTSSYHGELHARMSLKYQQLMFS